MGLLAFRTIFCSRRDPEYSHLSGYSLVNHVVCEPFGLVQDFEAPHVWSSAGLICKVCDFGLCRILATWPVRNYFFGTALLVVAKFSRIFASKFYWNNCMIKFWLGGLRIESGDMQSQAAWWFLWLASTLLSLHRQYFLPKPWTVVFLPAEESWIPIPNWSHVSLHLFQ